MGLRMKRLAEFAPNLDLFGQRLVAREQGAWIITDEGRAFLAAVEHGATLRPEAAPDDRSATGPPQRWLPCLHLLSASTNVTNGGVRSARVA